MGRPLDLIQSNILSDTLNLVHMLVSQCIPPQAPTQKADLFLIELIDRKFTPAHLIFWHL